MAITLAEKPLPGELTTRILQAKNKKLEKAKILAEVDLSREYQREGIQIKITSKEVDGDMLKVLCTAKKDGVEIPLDLPFFFHNPPCCVPNGTYRKEVLDGEEVTIPNHEENPMEALKQIVFESVKYNMNGN